ncbi:hypothetical protein K445DRAFT_164268 [Daldinia sp. EC12]|nr:hypothetical protein K445DRAFT_164268 [Daldinia sp. EC12]
MENHDEWTSKQKLRNYAESSLDVKVCSVFNPRDAEELDDSLINLPVSYGWRPSYLRRRTIVILDTILMAGIIVLESLDAVSLRHSGLGTANQSLFYMWSLGPTIVLTIILTFWARVEYQALRYIPWIALKDAGKRHKHARYGDDNSFQTILLDYNGASLPITIVTAIKNKHFLVLSVVLTSVILRVQIVLTSGLFSVNLTQFSHEVPVDLLDSFSDHVPEIPKDFLYDPRLYGAERASWSIGLNPNFTIPGLALQKFDAEKTLASMGNTTELSVVVEGITASLDCENPQINVWPTLLDSRLNYEGSSRLLNATIKGGIYVGSEASEDEFFLMYYWEDLSTRSNFSAPFFLAIAFSSGWNRTDNTSIPMTAAVLCKMTWPISQYMATYKAGALSIQPLNNRKSRSVNGGLFEFLWRAYPSGNSSSAVKRKRDEWSTHDIGLGGMIPTDKVTSNMDLFSTSIPATAEHITLIPFQVGMSLYRDSMITVQELLQSDNLEQVMRLYHTHYSSLMAHYDLRTTIAQTTEGSLTQILSQVDMQTPICQTMVGLFGLAIILTLPLFWLLAPKDGFVPREARTLAGLATLLSKSGDLLDKFRGYGSADLATVSKHSRGLYSAALIHRSNMPLFPAYQICDEMQDTLIMKYDSIEAQPDKSVSWYQPWTLSLIWRGIFLTLTICSLVALIMLLDISDRSYGLGMATNDDLRHYLWTLVPSAFFVGLSLYLGLCDFELRSLAPFVALRAKDPSTSSSLLVSFADELGIKTLWRSLKDRNLTLLSSKTIVFLCGLLPVFTPSLFSVEKREMKKTIRVREIEWFEPPDNGSVPSTNSQIAGASILMGNMSFPPWTYEDLVIPRINLFNSSLLDDDSMVIAEVQAIRAALKCSFSQGTASLEFDVGTQHRSIPSTDLPICSGKPEIFTTGSNGFSYGYGSDHGYILYSWGLCAGHSENSTSYTASLACYETIEKVNVSAALFGSKLEIKDSHPPIPNEKSARPSSIRLNPDKLYTYLTDVIPPQWRLEKPHSDGLLPSIVTSRYAIPMEWLGDEKHSEDVITAVKRHHGIFRAQALSDIRRPFKNTAAGPQFTWKDLPSSPSYFDAQLHYDALRVVQNSAVTHVLVSILGFIFVLHAFTMWRSEKEGYRYAIPKPPGSIAAIASLLADSNFFRGLPEDSQWATEKRHRSYFSDETFRMGWFLRRNNSGEKIRVFTIDTVEGDLDSDTPCG